MTASSTETTTMMTEQWTVIIASIAGWGFAAILGTIAVGLFLLLKWVRSLEANEGEDNDDD